LPVRITIQSDSLGGTVFWQELHSSVTTSSLGAINLVLGKGAKQSGDAATFSAIDWSVIPKFIKTEIDYGGWRTMGVSRLWAVPYSMIADDLGGPVRKLAVTGKTTVMDEALFEVKNKDGNIVFAVYNEGVRVYVADGAKGLKGGFAVGGFGTDKAESQKYLVESKDSVRIYLDSNPLTKKLKGGFAVGGYDMTKGIAVEDYLQVNRDSTRIYVKDGSGKSVKGGFAVGGFDMTKGTQKITPFTSLTPKNYFIGQQAGANITNGEYNIFIGHQAGYNTLGPSGAVGGSEGSWNCFIGYQAGYLNQHGANNTFIGWHSGYNNTSGLNTFLGSSFGYSNISGYSNTFIGNQAGFTETGSGKLIIENSSSPTPLVSGDFETNVFTVNGDVTAAKFNTASDAALKKNIVSLTDVMEKLKTLRGVYFDWNLSENSGFLLSEGRQIGVIAQEVEKVYPELVTINDRGYKMVDHTKLAPVLLEAIKEQQKQIEDQQKEIDELKAKVDRFLSD
jgi:hypothetical protein